MARKRPYFSKSGQQLQALFEANRHDPRVLRELIAELKHRSTRSAQALLEQVEQTLARTRTRVRQARQQSDAQAGAAASAPPTHETFPCRSCHRTLRVPVLAERTERRCPTCKAEFETFFKEGVLHVVWVETAVEAPPDHLEMTESLAREILGVSPDADFATIKAAWRKASQQYHPDKHQELPERLRRAAEAEMKRINEAYRLLEAATASEF